MHAKKTIVSICFAIVTILYLSIFYYNGYSPLHSSRIKEVIAGTSGSATVPKETVPPIVLIPINIERITSERYLFTLTKNIESKLSILKGTGILLESAYPTYDSIYKSGSVFIFKVQDTEMSFPISSYFFDTWNKKIIHTVSGEITTNSGTLAGGHKKVIALTFDDGPSPKYTSLLLDILKKENVQATFYILGSKAEQYPALLKREYLEGHEIGSHSYSHILYTKLSYRNIQEDLYKTDQAIYTAIGTYPNTFRPPYGGVNPGVLSMVPMPIILWSIDTRDWQTLSKAKNILSINNAKDGDIIIIHDIHETSVDSVADMIRSLKEQGFSFVTVSELLDITESNPLIGKKCAKKNNCK